MATAVLAMVLPGTDPISMLFEFVILYALYELSVVMATVIVPPQRSARRPPTRRLTTTATLASACCSTSGAVADDVPSRSST